MFLTHNNSIVGNNGHSTNRQIQCTINALIIKTVITKLVYSSQHMYAQFDDRLTISLNKWCRNFANFLEIFVFSNGIRFRRYFDVICAYFYFAINAKGDRDKLACKLEQETAIVRGCAIVTFSLFCFLFSFVYYFCGDRDAIGYVFCCVICKIRVRNWPRFDRTRVSVCAIDFFNIIQLLILILVWKNYIIILNMFKLWKCFF